jgi:hypothetical protein
VQAGKLLPQGMAFRRGLEGADLLFEDRGLRFDDQGLEASRRQHQHQQHQGWDEMPAPLQQQAEQGDGPADQPPAKVAGKEDADDPACQVAPLGPKQGRGEDEGEKGDAANPEGERQAIDNGDKGHDDSFRKGVGRGMARPGNRAGRSGRRQGRLRTVV